MNHRFIVGIVAACAALTLAACAARSTKYSTDTPFVVPVDGHTRINELEAAITAQQATVGWDQADANAARFPMDAALPMAEQAGAAACRGAISNVPRCAKMCELAGSICHNADQICQLADDMGANVGRDDWAKQKCSNAATACQQGQLRCCSCDGTPALGTSP